MSLNCKYNYFVVILLLFQVIAFFCYLTFKSNENIYVGMVDT